jgi:hypothetical protein
MTGSADAPALPDDPAMEARPIRRVAVIGTGVIGASWATCFLAQASMWRPSIRTPAPR